MTTTGPPAWRRPLVTLGSKLAGARDLWAWRRSGYAVPASVAVKRSVLTRHGRLDDIWIETGTFQGSTTAFLAQRARHVYTIEPGPELAAEARARFAATANVTVIEGLSEDCLEGVVGQVEGPVSFWLDGHFSAGITFQGPIDTPIRQELEIIGAHLDRLAPASVLVDDFRCFDSELSEYDAYPSRSDLVHWADRHDLRWTVEHDVFAARTR